MPSERITIHRTNVDKTEVIEQYPKTIVSQVYDLENGKFLNDTLKDTARKFKNVISIEDFRQQGLTDDQVFQRAIDYAKSTLTTGDYVTHINIPGGTYDFYGGIVSHPQIKLVADGYVVINSYLTTGSLIYIKYPLDLPFIGSNYRGAPISGGQHGIYIRNALYQSFRARNFGGDAKCLEIGTREAEDPTFSERFVARYKIDNILIEGFETGIQLNNISHFKGHYEQMRMQFCDVIVQVGEKQGVNSSTSLENFAFISCLFERSNTAVKWIRNSVGLTFTNCSVDYIFGDMLWATESGARRIVFHGGHIEKITGYLWNGDYDSNFDAVNTNIEFLGVQMNLHFGPLFRMRSLTSSAKISFDEGCNVLRDEYDNSPGSIKPNSALNRPMGVGNVIFEKTKYNVFEQRGVLVTGRSAVTNWNFKNATVGSLKDAPANSIPGFSNQAQVGAYTGIYEIVDSEPISGWDVGKKIRFKLGESSNNGNFQITTNKIRAQTKSVAISTLITSDNTFITPYQSIEVIINAFDYNDIPIQNRTYFRDEISAYGLLLANEWNLYSPITGRSAHELPYNTEYITITLKVNTTVKAATYEVAGLIAEFV